MIRTYLSLDPGGTTGYVHAKHDDKKLYLAPGQNKLTHRQIYDGLYGYDPDFVVTESFEYRKGERDDLILVSLEYIGVCHLWHQQVWTEERGTRLYLQKAYEGKSYFTDAKLKELGVYIRGLPHGMDAMRHLLHWFVMKRGYEFNNEPDYVLLKPKDGIELYSGW